MKKREIIIIIIAALTLAIVFNYFAGTTITVNGRQITGIGRYIIAYLAMLLLAAVLICVIPSAFVLIAVVFMVFGIFAVVFFPVLPFVFLLLPGIVFAGIVYLLYRLIKKKRNG